MNDRREGHDGQRHVWNVVQKRLNKLIFNRLPDQRQRQNPDCVGNQSHDGDIDIIIVHQHFPPLSLPGTG